MACERPTSPTRGSCPDESIPVYYTEGHFRYVQIDYGSYENTLKAIQNKLDIRNQSILLRAGGDNQQAAGYDVIDNDDLERLSHEEQPSLMISRKSCGSPTRSRTPTLRQLGFSLPKRQSQLSPQPGPSTSEGNQARAVPDTDRAVVPASRGFPNIADGLPPLPTIIEEAATCLRIACYAALESERKDLSSKIKDLQSDVQDICLEFGSTMLNIRLKMDRVIDDLQAGYGYLREGIEIVGIKRIGSVRDTLKAIQKSYSDDLPKRLAPLLQKVQDVAALIEDEELNDGIAQERRKLDMNKTKLLTEATDAKTAIEESKRRLDNLDEMVKLEEERYHSAPVLWTGLLYVVKAAYFGPGQHQTGADTKKKRDEEKKKLQELISDEMNARREIARFTEKMAEQNNPKQMTELAIRGADQALKGLTSALKLLSSFWGKSRAVFDSIPLAPVVDPDKETGDERREVWASKTFETEIQRDISRFVELQRMSDNFRQAMTRMSEDMHACIKDIPSKEEAQKKIPELIKELEHKSVFTYTISRRFSIFESSEHGGGGPFH